MVIVVEHSDMFSQNNDIIIKRTAMKFVLNYNNQLFYSVFQRRKLSIEKIIIERVFERKIVK
jgi:hypothetical protein